MIAPGVECCGITAVGDFTRITAPGIGCLFDQFRQTKIKNLRVAITRDHDVVGLQIAMHDSGSVSFRQSFGRVLQEPQQLSKFSFAR